ncbi:integrase catalytic domain-containing protein [Nephila pilipes]|uniref:Integrase catalytic domain-containing protein n=1 Tax=Nephila pilipes TaxID=299642 RepID=A0A8X6TA18_NEPPI|nr:integrase catalytic domain-containing protein [Nephila pilipes]GFT33840.1 integrase catalytic domain-containing protein [Nephila pilipes]
MEEEIISPIQEIKQKRIVPIIIDESLSTSALIDEISTIFGAKIMARMDLRQRFRKEYLGQLAQKHNEKQLRNLQICEIVLVGDDNKIRLFWPLAKIIELIPGRDGKICTVKLKTQLGTVLRPIQCIYPLEIYSKESIDGELGGEEFNSNNVTDNENNVTSADAVIVRKFT